MIGLNDKPAENMDLYEGGFCDDGHPFTTLEEYRSGTEDESVWPGEEFIVANCKACKSSISWPNPRD